MKTIKRLLLTVTILFELLTCGAQTPNDNTIIIKDGVDSTTFDTIKKTLVYEGYIIKDIDKELGYLITEFKDLYVGIMYNESGILLKVFVKGNEIYLTGEYFVAVNDYTLTDNNSLERRETDLVVKRPVKASKKPKSLESKFFNELNRVAMLLGTKIEYAAL